MKKKFSFFYVLLFAVCFLSGIGCDDAEEENQDIPQQLERSAKIISFPMTIITADKLSGAAFPPDIKALNMLTKDSCKTLPIGGILRLGNGIYHNYNCISQLSISEAIAKDPSAITEMVDRKVTNYLATTNLRDFEALISPNQPDWDIKTLTANYIKTSTDSIFFFTASAQPNSFIEAANRSFPVYNNADRLRKQINQIVCEGRGNISVFYNFGRSSQDAMPITVIIPKKNTVAGDTCILSSRYEKLNDGHGGTFKGRLLEENSVACGFVAVAAVSGDTCINGSRYEKISNGKGGSVIGSLLEANSNKCGVTFPAKGTPADGYLCENTSKYLKLHDGKGGFVKGKLIEANSKDCGAIQYPARGSVADGFVCENFSKFQKLNDGKGGFTTGKLIEANSKDCGAPQYPAKNSPAGFMCAGSSKYEKLHDGKGGFMRGKLLEANSQDCGAPQVAARGTLAKGFLCNGRSKFEKLNDGKGGFMKGKMLEEVSNDCKIDLIDNNCFKKSEPTCEQVAGNFTGRRVQYCYNKLGRIVRVIVLSKCDSDCRCF